MTSTLANFGRAETSPRHNGAKVAALLTAGKGHADLYRTVTAGPSGQRANLHIARVWTMQFGPYDFRIVDPTSGETAGYARRDPQHGWSITAEHYDGTLSWVGYAPDSLTVGCDVLINGVHAATGRHDSRRIDGGTFRTRDQVADANAREHAAQCQPCRTAGQRNGWTDCVGR